MTTLRSPLSLRPFNLSINSSYRDDEGASMISTDFTFSPISSTRASFAISPMSSTSGQCLILCSVLCLFDFEPGDVDQLGFSKNEILEVVKQEDSGWWAALRPDELKVGWIPKSFVKPLSDAMADKLKNVREEHRIHHYEAETRSQSAPIVQPRWLSPPSSSSSDEERGTSYKSSRAPSLQLVIPADLIPSYEGTSHIVPRNDVKADMSRTISRGKSMPLSYELVSSRPQLPPIPSRQNSSSKSYIAPLSIKRTNPPTPVQKDIQDSPSVPDDPDPRSHRPRMVVLSDSLHSHHSLESLDPFSEVDVIVNPQINESQDTITPAKARGVDIEASTSSFSSLPWYLGPRHTPGEIRYGEDGAIFAGTLPALVERLTMEPLSVKQMEAYCQAFLMTFRTFATADVVFNLLVEQYEMDHPVGLTASEFDDWKDKKLRPVQQRVLTIFLMWLEDHGLLREEPHIAQRLKEFLSLVVAAPPLAVTAKLIIEQLERRTSGGPGAASLSPVRRPRKSRPHRNDLLRLDSTDIAEQLCLIEQKFYCNIQPQECINWVKTQSGPSVLNLHSFCKTHDRLASWVKASILNTESLGRRADTVDFWIKVTEKCHHLQNFSSMSALISALTSAAISRLHLTWAHSSRRSNLEPLSKYNDPAGGFAAYRKLLSDAKGPCLPFIGMFLTDIVHNNDQRADCVASPSNPDMQLICFLKRQRLYDIIHTMLRHQAKMYPFAENESTKTFIESHLDTSSSLDSEWFWEKTQEVQQMELANVDIRKGLEAAGF